jgi:hypothetical protein
VSECDEVENVKMKEKKDKKIRKTDKGNSGKNNFEGGEINLHVSTLIAIVPGNHFRLSESFSIHRRISAKPVEDPAGSLIIHTIHFPCFLPYSFPALYINE